MARKATIENYMAAVLEYRCLMRAGKDCNKQKLCLNHRISTHFGKYLSLFLGHEELDLDELEDIVNDFKAEQKAGRKPKENTDECEGEPTCAPEPISYAKLKQDLESAENAVSQIRQMLWTNTGTKLRGVDTIVDELENSRNFECIRLMLQRYDPYDETAHTQYIGELPIEEQAFRESLIEFLKGWKKVYEDSFNESLKDDELPF